MKFPSFPFAWMIGTALVMNLSGRAAHANPPRMEVWHTEKVVMLMREGLLSSGSESGMSQYSDRARPAFDVGDGQLTANGHTLLKFLGRYQRERLAGQGFLPAGGTLDAHQIRAYSGDTQGHSDSARAFLEGFAPGNHLLIDTTHIVPLLERVSVSLLSEFADANEAISLYVANREALTSVRAALGFHWQSPEHLSNGVAPGGMLMFERVRYLLSGERFVRISYHSPSTDQIRHLQAFDDARPPFMAVFEPPESYDSLGATLWPVRHFERIVRESVTGTVLAPQSATSVVRPSVTLKNGGACRALSSAARDSNGRFGPASGLHLGYPMDETVSPFVRSTT